MELLLPGKNGPKKVNDPPRGRGRPTRAQPENGEEAGRIKYTFVRTAQQNKRTNVFAGLLSEG